MNSRRSFFVFSAALFSFNSCRWRATFCRGGKRHFLTSLATFPMRLKVATREFWEMSMSPSNISEKLIKAALTRPNRGTKIVSLVNPPTMPPASRAFSESINRLRTSAPLKIKKL